MFSEEVKRRFKKIRYNFDFFFSNYLEAYSKLAENSANNKKYKYDFIYANSGLRRELYYLLSKGYNAKVIVPIRKFDTYYYSKIKGRFDHEAVTIPHLKEAWAHWRNKTVDYIYLKKIFPKNIIIVKFEDLEIKKKNCLKKIVNFLGISYSDKISKFTSFNKKVLPNSSFINDDLKRAKRKNLCLKSKYVPEEYYKIYNQINKLAYKY